MLPSWSLLKTNNGSLNDPAPFVAYKSRAVSAKPSTQLSSTVSSIEIE